MQIPRRRWFGRVPLLLVIGGGVSCTLMGIAAVCGLTINLSPSLPMGLYRATALTPTTSLTREAIVLACLPHRIATLAQTRKYLLSGSCPGNTMPAGKRVLAIAGDTVIWTSEGFVRDGTLISHTQPRIADRPQHALPQIPFGRYVTRPNEVWLYAPHVSSLDSRYFGATSIHHIKAALQPIWTQKESD